MTLLRLDHVARRFGGNDVLRDVSLDLRAGDRVALIGPNGAGKSTLFNLISGALPVTSGRVLLDEVDITRLPPHRRVRYGIGRSFQLTSLLSGLSVQDNLLLALHGRRTSRYDSLRGLHSFMAEQARARELLVAVDLWDRRGQLAATLAYGQQKRLEIAMALALEPRVLLLDEPAAGLATSEVHAFLDLVRGLVTDTCLLFTEHDMDVVFGLAERIVVLYGGLIVASGTAGEIRMHPKVREIYLGAAASRDGQH